MQDGEAVVAVDALDDVVGAVVLDLVRPFGVGDQAAADGDQVAAFCVQRLGRLIRIVVGVVIRGGGDHVFEPLLLLQLLLTPFSKGKNVSYVKTG